MQSVGFSELFTLSKDDIVDVLKDYPAVMVSKKKAKQEVAISNPYYILLSFYHASPQFM